MKRKAVTVLQYSFLIAVTVGVLLTMQNYIKRSMQGQLQTYSDSMGEQYSRGLTNIHDHYSSTAKTTEWKLPTFNIRGNGGDCTHTQGTYTATSERELLPLDAERWN
ncbi:MAG: hypothetical protein WCI77_05605 [Candidatus Omnitrophota bacterium]